MKISGTGNPTTRLNEITADDIATFRNYTIGFDSGVIKGFEETDTDISVTLTSGIMFAYSYVGYEKTKTFYFNKTSATQYHFIYGEIDRSVIPNTFELKVKNNQSGSEIKPTTFRQDILSQVKTGVFQLPLYRVKLGSNGIEEVKPITEEIATVGVAVGFPVKNYIKRVKHADITTKKVVGEISDTATATTQLISDYSEKIATTMFVHNACRNYIDNNVSPTTKTVTVRFSVIRGSTDISSLTFTNNNYATPQYVLITGNNADISTITKDDNIIMTQDEYFSSGKIRYSVRLGILDDNTPDEYTVTVRCVH